MCGPPPPFIHRVLFHFLAQGASGPAPSQWATDIGYLMDNAGVLLIACSTAAISVITLLRQKKQEDRQAATEAEVSRTKAKQEAQGESIDRVAETARRAALAATPRPPQPTSQGE